jgi:O-antigen/teichoic acid export membrane protein
MNIENPRSLGSRIPSAGSPACLVRAKEEDRNRHHFRTEHLLTDLRGRTISSVAITMSAQAAKFGLSLTSTVILARLLMPRDFGLVAMVTTVTSFLLVFKDAGLSIATVQREGITHAQVSNLFWVNIGVSLLSSLIVAALAPVIASFYRDARLIHIALFLSATFLISGSTIQHQALLKRQMRFKAMALIDVGSMAVGVVVGIMLALLGYRYWSLVGLSLSMEAAGLLLTWSVSRWRPRLPSRRSGIRPLLSFGANLTLSSFIFYLARGMDNVLIGRVYGPASVGLYSRANALLMRPLEQFLGPINAVFVPTLSRLQGQPERYRSTFLRLYEAVAVIGFLFTSLFLALAHPLTLVLLGPKWEQATIIFGGFTIAALAVPLAGASTWLFTSQGRGGDMLVAGSINAVVTVLSFIVGLPFGPVGVAMVFSLSSLLIRLPILYFVVGRRGPVRTWDLWAVFFRHLPIWVVVFCGTWLALILVANLGPLAQLFICAPIGLLVGVAVICSFASQRKVATYLIKSLRELRRARLDKAIMTIAPE